MDPLLRIFHIIQVQTSTHNVIDVKPAIFKGRYPSQAVKKMGSRLFRKHSNRRIFIITMREKKGTREIEYIYKASKTKLRKPIIRFPNTAKEFKVTFRTNASLMSKQTLQLSQQKGGTIHENYTYDSNTKAIHYIIQAHGSIDVKKKETNGQNQDHNAKVMPHFEVPNNVIIHLYTRIGTCLMINKYSGSKLCLQNINPSGTKATPHYSFYEGQTVPNFQLEETNYFNLTKQKGKKDKWVAEITRCKTSNSEPKQTQVLISLIRNMTLFQALEKINDDFHNIQEHNQSSRYNFKVSPPEVHIHCVFCSIVRKFKKCASIVPEDKWPDWLKEIQENAMEIDTEEKSFIFDRSTNQLSDPQTFDARDGVYSSTWTMN